MRLSSMLILSGAAHAQGTITTVAGAGFADRVPALQSHLSGPSGIAVDSTGNVFLADYLHILRLDSTTGILSAVAGGGDTLDDGPAMSMSIQPGSIALEKNANILFLHAATLKRLDLKLGTITTIAGHYGANQSRGDGGPAKDSYLSSPEQFCVDSNGNIYIAELDGRVRRIDGNTGIISTYAGTGGAGSSGDGGPAVSATFTRLTGIAADTRGNVFLSDYSGHRVRKVDALTGIITSFAVLPTASLDGPYHLARDSSDNIYAISQSRIWRLSLSGVVTAFAGTGQGGFTGDGGLASEARISTPFDLAFNTSGDAYLSDSGNSRVRMVRASTGIVGSVAGTSVNGDGGLALGAELHPLAMAINSASSPPSIPMCGKSIAPLELSRRMPAAAKRMAMQFRLYKPALQLPA